MKKKKILLLLLLIISIVIIIITFFILRNNNDSRIKKGYEIFGNDYCNGHSPFVEAGQAFTGYTCKICGYEGDHPNTAVPTICSECAKITGRCSNCGKLLKNSNH